MTRRSVTAVLLATMLLSPGLAAAQQAESLEEIVTELASTPEHHQALAAHYREEAKQARDLARRHESMARVYKGGKQRTGAAGGQHCNRIAEKYRAMATEYDELAELHAEQAK